MKEITVQPSGKLYRAILYHLNRKKTNPGETRRNRNPENTKSFPRHSRCAARNSNGGARPPQAMDVPLARSPGADGEDLEKTGAARPGVVAGAEGRAPGMHRRAPRSDTHEILLVFAVVHPSRGAALRPFEMLPWVHTNDIITKRKMQDTFGFRCFKVWLAWHKTGIT